MVDDVTDATRHTSLHRQDKADCCVLLCVFREAIMLVLLCWTRRVRAVCQAPLEIWLSSDSSGRHDRDGL